MYDVENGEEVIFVLQFCNQFQFLLDQLPDLAFLSMGPAYFGAFFHQLPQICRSTEIWRYQFFRIFIAKFIQGEVTQAGYPQCVSKKFGRVEGLNHRHWAQVFFPVGKQQTSGKPDRLAHAYGRDNILQWLPVRMVHMHIASCDQG